MQKFGFSVSKRLIGVYDLNATVNLWVSEKKTHQKLIFMDFKKGLDHYQLKLKPWFSSNIFKIYKGIRLKPTTLTNLINCIPIYSNSSPLLDLKPQDKQKTFSLFTMKSKDCLIS